MATSILCINSLTCRTTVYQRWGWFSYKFHSCQDSCFTEEKLTFSSIIMIKCTKICITPISILNSCSYHSWKKTFFCFILVYFKNLSATIQMIINKNWDLLKSVKSIFFLIAFMSINDYFDSKVSSSCKQ